MNYKIFGILAFAAVLSACSGSEKFAITGQFENVEGGEMLYLKNFVGGRPNTLDSTTINPDGSFTMELSQYPKLDFYGLTIDNKAYLNLILDSIDEPVINADAQTMQKSLEVSGSPFTTELAEFYKKGDEFQAQISVIMETGRSLTPEQQIALRDSLSTEYKKILDAQKAYVTSYIDANPESPVSLAMVWKLDKKEEFDRYLGLTKTLENVLRHSDSFQRFRNDIRGLEAEVKMQRQQEEAQRRIKQAFAPGKPAPEITMNDINGSPISLSSLRGKTVLIDFWASWCKPCRIENPNVVRLYNKYKSKGFEIFSVSLDTDKNRWANAITQDGLVWPSHVSDLAGWKNAAAQLYGVSGIPYTVLIDTDGNIIKTELRGRALEQELAKIYGA